MRPGDAVLLRSVYDGRVRWAFPHRFVAWAWKDEDDFAEAQALGILDPAAAAIRAEGETVIAERPWPTGWEEWRPDPAWTPPPLPDGWPRT